VTPASLQLARLHPEGSLLLSPLAQRHAPLSNQNILTSRCFGDFIHGLIGALRGLGACCPEWGSNLNQYLTSAFGPLGPDKTQESATKVRIDRNIPNILDESGVVGYP
jgi:hypothetical protein